MKQVVQIVPHLPPRISGVGDYALLLAGELLRTHDTHTTFIVGDPGWKGPQEIHGFPVTQVTQASASRFEMLMNSVAPRVPVLLHYVGYGYQRRGCPSWLVRGLREWRGRGGEKHLVTMFHELYAFGWPWTSSFWTSFWQRSLAARLVRLSDRCITNMRQHARRIEGWFGVSRPSQMAVLPVFSNVGELTHPRPWKERQAIIVVFGNAGWREQVYRTHRDALLAACRSFDLDQVIDVGPRISLPILPVRLVECGTLSPVDASQLMSAARFGFLACPAHCLGKSSIFAAYASHEMTPVTYESNVTLNEDGIRPGEHYVAIGRRTPSEHVYPASIARNLSSWYRAHSLTRHGSVMQHHLESAGHKPSQEVAVSCG